MSTDVLLEAVLFYKSTPLRKSEAAAALGITAEELTTALSVLQKRLQTTALTVIETENEIQLVTAPHVSQFVAALRRDELRTEIGKAGAETLAIILYKEPISRADIDRIRGVNSSMTIRNLLTRGLIAKQKDRKNGATTFTITPELLLYLGIEKKQDLPEYGAILDRIEAFETTLAASEAA